ncbi:diacylglycerol kinase [Wenyingzhuangia sp. 2_MG-2023]|uniref:diacylglycerol kinase n=1 Tax=Wenyingzhuangia sp. 2_MG-2023 TaxID=3062639 RepID=UPI0026E4835B|nr:diacylglycerol kinase family protein [Wenyingzhuangia sp. 2_MG-2023]MDO6737326.1 diacylglycerol kinase family protein [Wenyingzhuangia sp. 2_MG-2023]MDO6803087.1 diacylglycerol kinase family protein [Wenyingzhuangia sp. 1_MG-2023]
MKTKKHNLVVDRIYSLGYAIKGLLLLLQTENAIKVHAFSTILLTIIGFIFQLNATEWMFQFLTLGLVISIEALNTSVEKIADFIQPNFDEKIGTIKDVSAGAVLFSGVFGAIVVGIIYIPKIILYFNL